MLQVLAASVLLLVVVIAGFVAVFVAGMRAGWPPVVDAVRLLNRRWLNPKQMETAGTPGAYASLLRHTGRVSGTTYETPLSAIATDKGFVIALVYGSRTEWLKNVLASGEATIVDEGTASQVDRPEVVPMAQEALHFSSSDRRSHRIMGVDACLRLRRVEPEVADR